MTFIASVVSKEGVAIIADSLVTSSKPVLEFGEFQKYIDAKSDQPVVLDPAEIVKLFTIKPSHTKDFEEKLYEYDKFTAITTAGAASINGKKIKEIVTDAKKVFKPTPRKAIQKKVNELESFILTEVKTFLATNTVIYSTVLIITHYDPKMQKATIFRMQVNSATTEDLLRPNFEFIKTTMEPEDFPVICDGHNKVSERLLFGPIPSILNSVEKIISKIFEDFKIDKSVITDDYIGSFLDNIATEDDYNDVKIHKLSELSLQQAVDLASLLMRIEIDIQKYTENIPTVGGVIKLAVIERTGFRFISGNEIVKHENFYSH